VIFWSGLRGAVAVAMALALPASVADREQLQEIVFGVVLFTLLIQGTTIDRLIRRFVPAISQPTSPVDPATP
jgi:CPA1 family monovalent cation:H+ antiporter